ncbi:glycoside hydrolase family 3 N-terminal domain-containing protein [Draconibacterium sp. IB214405]|uniref:glycoside hydrolase family 3 N-terminal domain-containing protein n=1 Tax=Draconibacterium sp. IB214405 TaxID=3097352 RepID=UPI002A13026D|nr:glycoside hydrolase family 3 N-terminal domain-containing protein [Draconibacterium sp. IB214405]MDX8338477.1 glycoside hydrolase family 3 N-terminal domain-containing protein [Draconibacterium sp. IB214405]
MKPTPNIVLLLVLFVLIFSKNTSAQEPPFLQFKDDEWVNQQLERMSLDERIAQLMMITVYPKQNDAAKAIFKRRIEQWKPGGILVMQGSPAKNADWINQFQEASETPLLVAIDGEWGPAMRTDSTIVYPYAQSLGAVQDTALLYQMGKDFADQLKRMGIQMNFAPVADINTNPYNPVIGYRSYGEDKHNVAQKSWMVAKGMQDAHVVPVAKHFPGHGDTKTDSHKTLPLVQHSKSRIDTIESYPFRYLSKRGITGIMTGHLNIPSLDDSGTTSSLSNKVVTNYLKDEIGYKGFVVTDAITMKGVVTTPGRAELEALIAGNDMIEFVEDVSKAVSTIKEAIAKGEISEAEINEKCRTVLALKRWVGLNNYQPADLKNITVDLNAPQYQVTNRKLIKQSMTVLINNNNTLPVQDLENRKIATVIIGGNQKSAFQKMLAKYTDMDHFWLPKDASEKTWANLRQKLGNYNFVIAGIEGINKYSTNKYGISEIQQQAVMDLVHEQNVVFSLFGSAYALQYFANIQHSDALIVAHQDNELTQELAAQLVFGAFKANGKLPVSSDRRFNAGDGLEVKANKSFAYTIPEEAGMNSATITRKIDSLANLGISERAFPGCQVLVAKDGQVVFHKCYGYQTYDSIYPVNKENIYDWASVTKVTGPLPALMKLVDEGKINVDDKFSKYWPDFIGSNKENLTFREILAHQSSLASWIAFWTMTVQEDGTLDKNVFKESPSSQFDVRISEHLCMNHDFRKTMFDTIRTSELLKRKKYLYSGLSFYLYPDIIENLTGTPYESYVKNTFYEPLGAKTITFNAYKHFPMNQIIPTEVDDFFRMEKLRGYVHDEGAAMMGGVSGNAGLFGSANDLAKVFQMYLQKGYFGGRRYISEATVNEFIRIQYPENENRRGLGFDKPLIDNDENKLKDAYPAVSSSKNSFGHSGYTGTFAWADPDNGLLYIFMSNRVYPTRNNSKLYDLNIRTAMHQGIYDSISTDK